jgi:YHS domain-containing protein
MATSPRCPVCGMPADSEGTTLEYRHMHFAFCSEPCRERFQRSPEAYLGTTGRQRRQGRIKQRRLRLGQRLSGDQRDTLRDLLEGMMGVRTVDIRGDRVAITYDPDQASDQRLEDELADAGERLGRGWPERLRRAFIHCEEESGG